MFWAIGFLIFGIVCGRLLRNHLHAIPFGPLTFAAILGLLFIMGAQLGTDATLENKMHILGLRALVISCASIAGTILVALIAAKLLNKKKSRHTNLRKS